MLTIFNVGISRSRKESEIGQFYL